MELNEQQAVHLQLLLEDILDDENISKGYKVITEQILNKLYEYHG